MAIYDFFLSRNNAASTLANYIGHTGRLFYDSASGVIKLSDGVTPGGLSIPYTIATDTVVGGIKSGPGVVINSEGQILIDSAGLQFSFGDLTGTVETYAAGNPNAGEDYALLSSVNANEDIVLASNGTGIVKVLGDFSVRAPNGNIDNVLLTEPIFRVFNEGYVRFLVPKVDPMAGAFEVSGNSAGLVHPPNQTGVIIHTTGNDGLVARQYLDANNNYPIIVGRRYNGSVGNVTPVLNNEIFFRIAGQASTGTDFETYSPASITFIATEDQSTGNQGGKIAISVTANGTSAADVGSVVPALEITPEGITTTVGFVGDGSRITDVRPTLLSVAASSTAVVANSDTATTITGMTLSPPSGTYLVSFSSEYVSTLTGSVTATAAADLATLYAQLTNLTVTNSTHAAAFGSGETLGPGVYTVPAAWSIASTLTLNGGPTDLFVFRGVGALTTSNGAEIVLTGGATSNNVFWVSQGAISTGSNAVLKGTFLANQAANDPGAGLELEGRILTVNGAISINTATITAPTGTVNSSLTLGTVSIFSVFAAIGAVSSVGTTSNIAQSIGSNSAAVTGFASPNVVGGTIYSSTDQLAVIEYGIYVAGVQIADSMRIQSQTSLVSGWPMSIQTIATVAAGQTVTVKTIVPTGGFTIGPAMRLILMPVVN
jgi:hypothetical protein